MKSRLRSLTNLSHLVNPTDQFSRRFYVEVAPTAKIRQPSLNEMKKVPSDFFSESTPRFTC